MADVKGESRAQLFLVGALSLAVVFVVLAVILNSAIYTENLATRGTDSADGRETTQFRHDVEQGVGGLVAFANRNRDGYDSQKAVVEDGVNEIGLLGQAFSAKHGNAVTVEFDRVTNGTEARQYTERNFTDDSDSPNWVAAADVDNVRSFNQTVDPTTLTDTDLGSLPGDTFYVSFEDDGDDATNDWRVFLYRDASASDLYVGVVSPSGTKDSCGPYPYAAGERVDVSITGSTVAGERCPYLDFTDDLSGPYDIEYHNGDSASGTYRFVVDQEYGTFTDNLPGTPYTANSDNDPTTREALYSATVRVTYQSSGSLYETEVTAVPGDSDA